MGTSVASALHMYDLERVEILRGPQGTLFGRNTTAGSLAYETKKASLDKSESYATLTLGNHGLNKVTAAVSGPLIENTLAGRIAVVYNDRDGYTRNQFLGTDVNGEHYAAVRGSLKYAFSDQATWDFSLDYRDLDQDPLHYQTLSPSPILEFGVEGFPGGPTFQFTSDGDPSNFSMSQNEQNRETLEGFGFKAAGVISYQNFDLTSITAYREHEYFSFVDTDRTAIDWAGDGDPEDQKQFSQELRFTSTNGEKFDWILGLFLFTQETESSAYARLYPDLTAWIGLPPTALNADASGSVDADSAAIFGQGVFHLSDAWELTVGLRLNYDKKSIVYSQTDDSAIFVPGGIVGAIDEYSSSDSWLEPTGDITLAYQFNDDVMGYVKASRGYKAGGFNDSLGSDDNPAFGPEFVLNFEAGLRSSFFDNQLVLNATAFHMDWSDVQVRANTTVLREGELAFGVVTGNFGEAESTGLEIELQAAPTDKLRLFATAAFLDAEFTTGDPVLPGEQPIIARGNKLPGADASFTAGFSYEQPVTGGTLLLSSDYLWTGDRELIETGSNGNDPVGSQDSFSLLNARVSFTTEDDRYSLSLWGKNLTDERYFTRALDLNFPPIFSYFGSLGAPRAYGLDLKINF